MHKDCGSNNIRIGDVFLVEFHGEQNVQNGLRPAVVFQNNIGNTHSPNVVVLPLTSSIKKANMPTHVYVSSEETGLIRDSLVLCENPVCISKEKLGTFLLRLPEKYIAQIAVASLLASSAISFVEPTVLLTTWQKSLKLNSVA